MQLKASVPDDVNLQALKRPGPFIVFNSPVLEFFGKPVSPCCKGFIPGNHIEQVRRNALMNLGIRIQITQQFFLCYWFSYPSLLSVVHLPDIFYKYWQACVQGQPIHKNPFWDIL